MSTNMNMSKSEAVFHVREHDDEVYLRVDRPMELLDAVASAVAHLELKKLTPESLYRENCKGAEEITKADFDAAVSERMENTGVVTGAFRLDFDKGEFTALHIMDGWKTFRMEDVCSAMRKVVETEGFDRDEMFRTLTEQLDGKELRYNPVPTPTCSVLHVTSCGESRYALIDTPIQFSEIAEGLRQYLGMSGENKPASFAICYTGAPLTPDQFDEHVSNFMNLCSHAAGVYDVNLDTGNFCVLRAGQGWERYRVNDVCRVAWMASHEQTFKAREEYFDAEMAQRKSMLIPPAVFDHAVTVAGNDLRLAVLHVREQQADAWFSLSAPMESFNTAIALRSYLQKQTDQHVESFSNYYREARSMSRNDYEWYTANRLGRGDIVTDVYDLDLDGGAFSVLSKDGWKNYPVEVVCEAAYQASNLTHLSPIPEQQRFLDRIAGHEIQRDGLEIYVRGDRHLDPGDIFFSGSVEQMDEKLNFYMDVCFSPDAVLGTFVSTDENDDYVNAYANYDLERGELCDDMDVMLWRDDGGCLPIKYRLSTAEKESLLPKLAEHCQRDTGMTLDQWRERYLAEGLDESDKSPSEHGASAVQGDSADPFRTITVTLNEYKLNALEEQLSEMGTNVEEWLQTQLVQLYSDMVPHKQQMEIRERIDAEHPAPPQEPEPLWEPQL